MILLEQKDPALGWQKIGDGLTNAEGRQYKSCSAKHAACGRTLPPRFLTGAYYAAQGTICFHPQIIVAFTVRDIAQHYQVPLLIGPFGYSTCRGS
ncbi:MAG: hydroxyisourate hydrolase [Acidobacteria bacterium]|nr:hydroxyisourate hydrolase [Acidobacteriota bacterium]